MNLEKIGFYTLSDHRAGQSSQFSPLWRCELILTDKCNFKCPYCRGLRDDIKGTMELSKAMDVVKEWCSEGLKNVRFSGGEPTLYDGLGELVAYCKQNGVEHIAVSSNGSATKRAYDKLIELGVNDFSISLDSCCSSEGDKMAGNINGAWSKVAETIKYLSSKTYTSVGCVITEDNIDSCLKTIEFADSMNVSDIRVIPSAQFNKLLEFLSQVPDRILNKYPILKYRVENVKNGRHVRGLTEKDSHRCHLVLDDMAIAGDYHFPCIIKMREGSDPIGKVSDGNMRSERYSWMLSHDCHKDPICSKNCLDVCIDYNNKVKSIKGE